jgi:hypothetical protein
MSAKLIIIMSRNTVLMKGKDILIVPTADIAQFHQIASSGLVP